MSDLMIEAMWLEEEQACRPIDLEEAARHKALAEKVRNREARLAAYQKGKMLRVLKVSREARALASNPEFAQLQVFAFLRYALEELDAYESAYASETGNPFIAVRAV